MFGAPIPILRSVDESRTRAFYIGFLGFEVVFEHRFEPGMPLYLGLRRGECMIHLTEHHGDTTPGSALRIPVDDVIGYAAILRAKAYGHASPGEPHGTSWGTIEIMVTDPAGNRLFFVTPSPNGMSNA